jgi:hypothetical protein
VNDHVLHEAPGDRTLPDPVASRIDATLDMLAG